MKYSNTGRYLALIEHTNSISHVKIIDSNERIFDLNNSEGANYLSFSPLENWLIIGLKS